MKQKILYWFSTHCGFICCCLLLCFIIADVIKGDYHSIIFMLPFLVTWAMYAQKEKECEYARKRLQQADDFANDMKGKLDELEKLINEAALETEKYIIAAIPNGGFRNKFEASTMKAEGVLAGFSDLIIIADGNVLFVEVKTAKGYQSDLQKEFQANVERMGFQYSVCRSLQDFQITFEKWLKSKFSV